MSKPAQTLDLSMFPLPSTMSTRDALMIAKEHRGWTDEEFEGDIKTLEKKHRLRTVGDCRALAKDSWRDIGDIPLIVRDALRRIAWGEVAAVGPTGEVLSKKEFREKETEFRRKLEAAQQQAEQTGVDVEVENPMRPGSLTSAGTFIGTPTLVRGRKPPPPPTMAPPPPPPAPMPYYPQYAYAPQPVYAPQPQVLVQQPPPPGAIVASIVETKTESSDLEARAVNSAEDLEFGKKK